MGAARQRADPKCVNVQIRCRPAYAIAYLILDYQESAFVERGAFVSCTAALSARAGLGGEGPVRALKRKAFGGEPLLFNEFTAEAQGAWVAVAPAYPGDVDCVDITEATPLLVESGSLLAYSSGIHSDVRYTGARTLVMHEGIALIEVEGNGQAVISAYGGIDEVSLQDGETLTVDTGHIVAFDAHMSFDVGPMGSITSSVLTATGFVARFTGPGRVLLQTRKEVAFRDWLFPDHSQNSPHRH